MSFPNKDISGTKSGRDYDKAAETALTPFLFDDKFIGFEQAVLILACKKLYTGQIKAENFFDKTLIDKNYPRKDFHTVYSCEIVSALQRT